MARENKEPIDNILYAAACGIKNTSTMTQEEKQLLLKDLCGRLPYGCMVECSFSEDAKMDVVLFPEHITELIAEDLIVKPYLRPMSSMTEEERKEWADGIFKIEWDIFKEKTKGNDVANASGHAFGIDYLIERHFDYRGLIDKGLAIEAPEGMYKND